MVATLNLIPVSPAGVETPAVGTVSPQDPSLVSSKTRLLSLAIQEQAGARRDQAQAWVRRFISRTPSNDSPAFRELHSLLRENDSELFAEACLNLAQRNIRRDVFPLLTQELLTVASHDPATRERALSTLRIMAGGGSFGEQLEFQLPRLARELASPLMLGAFGTASVVARGAALGVLSRAGRLGWSTLVASEAAALAVEVPTLVLSRRIGAQIFVGGENLFSGESISRELLSTYGPFALLRGSGNIFQYLAPSLRGVAGLHTAHGELTTLGRWALGTAQVGTEVAAVMAGHSLNALLHVGPEIPLSGREIFFNSLLTVGHMRVAGHLVERLGFTALSQELALKRQRLFQEISSPPDSGSDAWNLPQGLAFGLAYAGRVPPPRRNFEIPNRFYSEGDSTRGGGGSSKPPAETPGSEPSPWQERVQKALDDLREYSQEANRRDTLLGRTANRLHQLAQRRWSAPDLTPHPSLEFELKEVEAELAKAQAEQGRISLLVTRLREGLQRLRGSSPQVDPKVVEEDVRIGRDEERVGKLAELLPRLYELLKLVKEKGWNEELRTQMTQTLSKLSGLYLRGLESIPGLNRLRQSMREENLKDRAEGAALGLATFPFHPIGSPLARELRGGSAPGGGSASGAFTDDLELEYLHRAVLVGAQRHFRGEDLFEAVESWAKDYHAGEESTAAMVLMVEALKSLQEQKGACAELLAHLQRHPHGRILESHLMQVSALLDPEISVRDGLEILASGSSERVGAADYFSSGLYFYLRTLGSPQIFSEQMQAMGYSSFVGFHPSIPVSLLGAAHGRSKIPPFLLPAPAKLEEFLERALLRGGE